MLETTTQSPEPCPRCGAALRPRPNPLLRGRRGWMCGTVDTPEGLVQSYRCHQRAMAAGASLLMDCALLQLDGNPTAVKIAAAREELQNAKKALGAAPEARRAVVRRTMDFLAPDVGSLHDD